MKRIHLLAFVLLVPTVLMAQQSQNYLVEDYLQNHLSELSLSLDDLKEYEVYRNYQSKKTRLNHVFIQQYFEGIPIHQAEIRMHWRADVDWLITQNTFVKNLDEKQKSAITSFNREEAIQQACTLLNIEFSKLERISSSKESVSMYRADFSLDAIPIMKTYFETPEGLRLAWDLTIYESDATDCWNVVIDAETGKLLRKYNWVKHCSFSSETVCEHPTHETQLDVEPSMMPINSGAVYHVFPVPIESPSHGDRSLEVDPNNSVASPYGWHDTNGIEGPEYTITRGNNVHAFADLTDSNVSQGDEPDGGDELYFDFPFDPMTEPDQNLDAATVNLFYMNNMMHDVWYHYGFDPEAGNFQSNNYGEGGFGGDHVHAQAQDSSGVGTNYALNNANFYTPNDGSNPVMQMYLWNKPENPYDLFTVNSPEGLSGTYEVSPTTDWAGQITSEPITGEIVLVDDGTTWSVEGCSELVNDLTGKIALISRGTCEFGLKALNAENAGAIAVIIYNNVGGMVNMAAGAVGADVTIPTVFMGKLDGELLRDYLIEDGVINATFVNNSPPGPEFLDGDFDNGIIAHEYGHGISSRLTGSSCMWGDEQAGEGWSDFFTLMMTNSIDDNGEEPHGIGTYVSAEQNDGRGIRSYPYSRDMSVNPMTYDYIITESVPHGVGSVLTTILWDLFWNFVDVYGYDEDLYTGTGGNNMVMQLVIDGLKLQPCNATFPDIREGILVADELLYGGQNTCLIWETFARRGVGFSAQGGTHESRADGIQSFDNMPECVQELKIQKSAQENAKAGDAIEYLLQIQNHTENSLLNVQVKDTLQSGLSYLEGSSNCELEVEGNVLTFNLGEMPSGATTTCTFSVHTDETLFSEVLFEDDMEDGDDYWTSLSEEGYYWELNAPEAYSGSEAWFAENLAERYETFLEMQPFTVEGEAPTLSFWHKYITEAGYDGGYISISTDEVNFEDLGPYIFRGFYRGESQGPPPLGGKDSFWGNSNGFVNTLVDLTDFIGETVTIRFTFVTDEGNSETDYVEGWTVDDVRIIDRYQVENNACVSSNSIYSVCDDVANGGTMIFDHYGVDLDEHNSNRYIQMYPNPASDLIAIRLSGDWTNKMKVTITDLQGKVVYSSSIDQIEIEISTSNFADGLYFVEISDSHSVLTKKMTVIH